MNFKKNILFILVLIFIVGGFSGCQRSENKEVETETVPLVQKYEKESIEDFNKRMEWWRDARFGLFIHWGLYAIPAGEWNGETNHAEWIRTTAQIPHNEYDKFAKEFNPLKFNAAEWVGMAKNAGMKYIVITSKHHDGFCLFDSKVTDFDVMDATPFKRDILKELAEECRKQGIKMCWYHSIMDWHHPDYIPRRKWETRSSEGANFDRYVNYMKSQVREIVQNYGDIGVLWFDGEWENTWNHELGKDLYSYVRSLQPDIIINNRVGVGRSGMAGTYDPLTASGDFGTPEQEIPSTGLNYDWETCMTMNDHWGYNKHNDNWKSVEDLIYKLVDIASKGGNFLLNVGPTAEGLFPQESIDRLAAIGKWMKINNESVYGTTASLFEKLDWGRSTTKGNSLYFHIFDWPENNRLILPGLLSSPVSACLLSDPDKNLNTINKNGSVYIELPNEDTDVVCPVVHVQFESNPSVVRSPKINSQSSIFIDDIQIEMESGLKEAEIRYTLDGSLPSLNSLPYNNPVTLKETATVKCQIFHEGSPVSEISEALFSKVIPLSPADKIETTQALKFKFYKGEWDIIPDFQALIPEEIGTVAHFDISAKKELEHFGIQFNGYIRIQKDGVYTFYLASDDGSRLWIGPSLLIDNDGLHGSIHKENKIALKTGLHPIRVEYFQKTGGNDLEVLYSGAGIEKTVIFPEILFHKK